MSFVYSAKLSHFRNAGITTTRILSVNAEIEVGY